VGVHTGPAEQRAGDYFGTALNRAARLTNVAHGGQIVVSQATADLARDELPGGCELVDLGEHRLRDLSRPERVYQVAGNGLERDFPRLRSLEAFPGNLPAQVTSFVGRVGELAAVANASREDRLVTLTGVGGVGKTRLAIQTAAEVLPAYPDGAWLCELAAAGDPDAMVQVVAAALGVQSYPGVPLDARVREVLGDRRVMLVLDNCEHLLEAVSLLAEGVMRECPRVRILATSREPLDIGGERVVRVRSLPMRDPVAEGEAGGESDAVRLFVDRASSAEPDFDLDETNARIVEDICRRLDGIPLAIELAAARAVAMSPAEILDLLGERFRLLTGGRRTAVERHQTLRATVDWSYSLLRASEQVVFARLGVFPASFDAAAARAVTGGDGVEVWDVLDALTGLVSKSMVNTVAGASVATRYQLLETMRQYALERLAESGESERTARRHAEWYAERAGRYRAVWSPDEALWLARAAREFDNFRAAIRFALDDGDADLAVRLVGPLYWISSLHRYELADWANDVLAVPGADRHPQVGQVHLVIARLAWAKGDLDTGEAAVERALRCALDEEAWALATAIRQVILSLRGRLDEAAAVLTEALERPLSPANRAYLAACLLWAGQSSTTASDRLDPFAVIADADVLRVPFLQSFARSGAAAFLTLEDRVDEAVPLFAEAADIARASGNRYALRLALTFGDVASSRLLDTGVDTHADVAARARRALDISHDFSSGFVAYLIGLVLAAHRAGQHDDAALVAGYLSVHGDDLGVAGTTVELLADGSLARFAEEDAADHYERGRTMTTDQLLAVLEHLATCPPA
jgi:predicted ATPase